MIHLYIRQNNIKDTRPHHGKVFNRIADRINKEGGWHIARTDSVEGCGFRNKGDKKTFYVCVFYSPIANKYFKFAMNKKYLDYYKNIVEVYPHRYVKPIIFTSSDDKTYAHYRACRRSIRGFYTTEEDYNYIKNNENILFDFALYSAA